jgi:hypothetical protein
MLELSRSASMFNLLAEQTLTNAALAATPPTDAFQLISGRLTNENFADPVLTRGGLGDRAILGASTELTEQRQS